MMNRGEMLVFTGSKINSCIYNKMLYSSYSKIHTIGEDFTLLLYVL